MAASSLAAVSILLPKTPQMHPPAARLSLDAALHTPPGAHAATGITLLVLYHRAHFRVCRALHSFPYLGMSFLTLL